MVNSKLDGKVIYPEKKDIYHEDVNFDFIVYDYTVRNIDIHLVLGNEIDSSNEKISFFPVYLVFNDKFITQIGVFEIFKDSKSKYLDEDGDIDVDLLNEILLFSFVSDNFLKKHTTSELTVDVPDPVEPSKPEEPFILETNWVNDFLNETKIKIYNQPEDGHCFFSAIQMAYSDKHTIDELRGVLSDVVDPSQFETYSALYNANSIELEELNKEILLKNKEINDIKQSYKSGSIKQTEKKLKADRAKTLLSEIKQLKLHLDNEEQIGTEYAFMRDVKSIDDLKQKIKTCGFWADSWAISKLEELLNFKVIIMSSDYYNSQEYGKVIQCPETKGKVITPEYYVVVDHTGNHYKLITYNDIKLFKFDTLPNSLKNKIVETCMKGSVGSFHEILDFRKYADSI